MDTLIELFLTPLESIAIPYMVVGSVASSHFGEPRYTADIDLVINIPTKSCTNLAKVFPEPDYYCPPLEVLLIEAMRHERAHFNIIHIKSGFKGDFYPVPKHPIATWAMEHRHCDIVAGKQVYFAPPEYVIFWKMLYYREGGSEKHIRDIGGIMRIQGEKIRKDLIETALADYSILPPWKIEKP